MKKSSATFVQIVLLICTSQAWSAVTFSLDFDNGLNGKDANENTVKPLYSKSVKIVDSQYGKALLADNSSMRLVYPASIIPAKAGTVEILLTPTGRNTGSKRLDFIKGIRGNSSLTSSPYLWLWNGRLRLDVGFSDRGLKSYVSAGRPEWKKYKWHLLTGTWDRDSGRLQVYLNGRLMRSDKISPWNLKQITDVTIGYGQIGRRVYPAHAMIASVNVFDRALSGTQIQMRARKFGIIPPVKNGPAPHPNWKNALSPKGKEGPELRLAKDGKSEYTILIPADVKSREEKAAYDLADWLGLITDATFNIQSEDEFKGDGFVISVGPTEYLKKQRIPNADKELARDGYAIAVKGKDLFIWGSDQGRGTINGVYALLEEDLGCRWYAPDSLMVKKSSTLSFRPVGRVFEPVLEVRNPHYREAHNLDWSIRNRTSASPARVPAEYGGQLDYVPGYWVHTFQRLMPLDEYYEKHPEYYSSLPGRLGTRQLCMTNPDVLRIVTEKVRRELTRYPDSSLISVDPNDGLGYCECKNCSKIYEAEGKTHAGPLLKFVNAVADGIKDDFPNVKVVTLAYLETLQAPKTIRPRENVVIRLCTDRHSWAHQFKFVTETQLFSSAMKTWSNIGANIHIWDYTINFRHYLSPMPNMPVVTKNMRWMIKHNAKGIMLQGNTQGLGASRAAMRCWVWAKQLWDPALNTRDLMRDFIYGYYGQAAEPIEKYNNMLWGIWQREHHRRFRKQSCALPPTSPVFSRGFIARATELFDEAESLATDPRILKRVRRARIPLLYMKLSRGKDYLPGEDYYALCDKFESITKEEGIRVLQEENRFRNQNHIPERLRLWRGVADLKGAEVASMPFGVLARFKTDPEQIGEKEKWFAEDLPDRDWAVVPCGQFWDKSGYKNYVGDGWYRIRFTVPPNFGKDRVLRILVGAVDEECVFWINGKKVFEHTVNSTGLPLNIIWKKPFLFDPTEYLAEGENIMAVKVRNSHKAGGIWRLLHLVAVKGDKEPTAEALIEFMSKKQ